jgi:succinate--hydroxymethylglutarate CoA-transferase
VGEPELKADPRFATQQLRARNQLELAERLQGHFACRPAAHWLAEFRRRGVPCAPINTYPEVLSAPQVEFLGLVRDLELPNGAKTKTTAFPVEISGFEFQIYRSPPELGADTEEVLADWLGPSDETAPGLARAAASSADRE